MNNTLLVVVIFLLVLILGIVAFYRLPNIAREVFNSNVLYSPAYGKVERIITQGDKTLVSIFLRISDIHSQYYPTNGVIKSRITIPGKYRMATKYDKTTFNAKVRTILHTEHGDIQIDQISGKLARKITTDNLESGSQVYAGDYLGRIHLGSRVNLTFPSTYHVQVREGDYVRGPDTAVAVMIQ
jgi:phosphatidylserine decarboxylase